MVLRDILIMIYLIKLKKKAALYTPRLC